MKNSILYKPCIEGTKPDKGSTLKTTLKSSVANLKEMFGEPAFEGYGDFVTTEFVIDYEYYDKDNEGTEYGQFTIYDWGYLRDFKNDYETISWHVGGKHGFDGIAAESAIRIFNNTDVRYGYDQSVLCHATWHQV